MIKVKHFLQAVEQDDGQRLWVEPFGLTKDLREWCRVEHVLPHLGPPKALRDWFEEHPDGYDYFRARYHGYLAQSKYKPALRTLAQAGVRETFTLLHDGDDPDHNSAVALMEFLHELEAWTQSE